MAGSWPCPYEAGLQSPQTLRADSTLAQCIVVTPCTERLNTPHAAPNTHHGYNHQHAGRAGEAGHIRRPQFHGLQELAPAGRPPSAQHIMWRSCSSRHAQPSAAVAAQCTRSSRRRGCQIWRVQRANPSTHLWVYMTPCTAHTQSAPCTCQDKRRHRLVGYQQAAVHTMLRSLWAQQDLDLGMMSGAVPLASPWFLCRAHHMSQPLARGCASHVASHRSTGEAFSSTRSAPRVPAAWGTASAWDFRQTRSDGPGVWLTLQAACMSSWDGGRLFLQWNAIRKPGEMATSGSMCAALCTGRADLIPT